MITIGGQLPSSVVTRALSTVDVDLSAQWASQAVLSLRDDGLVIAASGELVEGVALEVDGLAMEVDRIGVGGLDGGGEALVVTARAQGAIALRERGTLVRRVTSPAQLAAEMAAAAGLAVVAEDMTARTQVGRLAGETSWMALSRIAAAAGGLFFEADGTLYLGTPAWLLARAPSTLGVAWRSDATAAAHVDGPVAIARSAPACERSRAGPRAALYRVGVSASTAAAVRPGHALVVLGVPGFGAPGLVTSVKWRSSVPQSGLITAVVPR